MKSYKRNLVTSTKQGLSSTIFLSMVTYVYFHRNVKDIAISHFTKWALFVNLDIKTE